MKDLLAHAVGELSQTMNHLGCLEIDNYFITSQIIPTLQLVISYDTLEERHIQYRSKVSYHPLSLLSRETSVCFVF